MRCPNCKKEVRNSANFCPECGSKINRRRKRVWIFLPIAGILSVGTVVCIIFLAMGQRGNESEKSGIIARSAEEAIVQMAVKSEELGFENALSELTEKNSTEVDGDKYLRLQQNYKGIPVYGKTVVFAADSKGNMTSVTGNVSDVEGDLDLTPTVTKEQVNESVYTYLTDEIGIADTDDFKINMEGMDNLCIFSMGKEAALAYKVYANSYEILVDAHNADVLSAVKTFYENSVIYTDKDGKNEVEGVSPIDGEYILKDKNRNIYMYDAGKKEYWNPNTGELNPDVPKLVSGKDTIFGNEDDNTETSDTAYSCLRTIGSVYDYFKDKYNENVWDVLICIYNDKFEAYNGENAGAGIENCAESLSETPPGYDSSRYGGKMGMVILGKAYCENLKMYLDMVGHEYTHMVSQKYVNWVENAGNETEAINEGISDIFGEIIEAAVGNGADWEMGDRIIHDPSQNDYPEKMESRPLREGKWVTVRNSDGTIEESDYAHAYSTLISHVAYLMNKELSFEELGKLWYRAILMLPSDCDFAQCRRMVEYAAQSMEELTDEQRECVSEAFDEVGIFDIDKEALAVDYHLRQNGTLRVMDQNNEYYSGYTLHITGIADSEEMDASANIEIGSRYNSTRIIKEEGPYELGLKDGTYRFTVSDYYSDETYSFVVEICDEGSEDNITLLTSYEKPLVVKVTEEDIPYKPEMYDQIFQEYRDAVNTFTESEEEGFAEKFPNVSEFLVSMNVTHGMDIWYGYYDIDGNGVEELLFSYETIEGYEYKIVDVFSQDGEQIQKVGEDNTFSEYTGSRIYDSGVIYSSPENKENYYTIYSDGYHLNRIEKPDVLGNEIKIDWKKLDVTKAVSSTDSVDMGTVYAGDVATSIIDAEGNLLICGSNANGQLGSEIPSRKPTYSLVASGIKSVCGSSSFAAISNDDKLFIWGDSDLEQLEEGRERDINQPLIQVDEDVLDVALTGGVYAYVTNSGDLYAMGEARGSFGDEADTMWSSTPVKIMDNVKAVELSSNEDYGTTFAAITKSDELYMWGKNSYGLIRTDSTDYVKRPTKIMDNVKMVSLGERHVLALTVSNELVAWGDNKHGQLGIGNTDSTGMIEKIMNGVICIDTGTSSSLAVTENGDLYTWGNDSYGELGMGIDFESKYDVIDEPTKIMSQVRTASMDGATMIILSQNGDVFTCGWNCEGQLGTGDYSDRNVPVCVYNIYESVLPGTLKGENEGVVSEEYFDQMGNVPVSIDGSGQNVTVNMTIDHLYDFIKYNGGRIKLQLSDGNIAIMFEYEVEDDVAALDENVSVLVESNGHLSWMGTGWHDIACEQSGDVLSWNCTLPDGSFSEEEIKYIGIDIFTSRNRRHITTYELDGGELKHVDQPIEEMGVAVPSADGGYHQYIE